MSRLAERRARVSRSVDRAFAETLRITPMLVGGAVIGGLDPTRAPYDVVGVFQDILGTAQVKARGSGKGDRLEATAARRMVSFALGAFGDNPKPETGWHVTRLDADGQLSYRITPGGEAPQGRLTYDLVPLGAARQ